MAGGPAYRRRRVETATADTAEDVAAEQAAAEAHIEEHLRTIFETEAAAEIEAAEIFEATSFDTEEAVARDFFGGEAFDME